MIKRILAVLSIAALLCTGCTPTAPADTTPPSTAPTTEPVTDPTTEPTTIPTQPPTTEPEPQGPTLTDFLSIATLPVGSTMYVWGGGWNEEDTGAGIEAVTLGLSPQWATFASWQDSSYNYNNTRYQIHDGLDCSGYVGWAVYNVIEMENGRPGYVCASTKMAQTLADKGFGDYIPAWELKQWQPGDIMSMQGHCWIVVGQCGDGSVLMLHASPPGVMFSGTTLPDGSASQASILADHIMKTHYPAWYARYPQTSRPHSYLTDSNAMRWNSETLEDVDNLRQMTAEEVVAILFPDNE